MDLLATIPVWVYFIILLITYMGTHVLTFNPGRGLQGRAVLVARIGASLLLLLALVSFNREEPATLLLALVLSGSGGFLSGRSTPPPKAARSQPDARPGSGDTASPPTRNPGAPGSEAGNGSEDA